MKRWRTVGICLLLTGCQAPVPANTADPIYNVSRDDSEMNAAKDRAIARLPEFYGHLARPRHDESEFTVKFDIVPGHDAEYVWADQLDRSSTPMTGVLVNQPLKTAHRLGERVPIPEESIIDWMYRRGRVMQGGFTHRVLLDHMSPQEAAAERESLGW